jgi:Domain of unknown function (DUF4331)
MSSHREAPEISKDPVADSTDLYAFVSPDQPDMVTLIANYIPLEGPDGGPNFFEFGDDVRYAIHIDNDGDGAADITYVFRFTTSLTPAASSFFLYNTGPMTTLPSPNWSRPQTFTLTEIRDGQATVLGHDLLVPPCNIGPLSTPTYTALANKALQHNRQATGLNVFAGQRAEGFYVDLGAVFDLGDLRPFQQLHVGDMLANMPGVNSTDTLNVHSLAIQVPINRLTRGGQRYDAQDPRSVIGVWTTASRQIFRGIEQGTGRSFNSGPFTQISRLGNPLFNEVLIPLADKDYWNAQEPRFDKQFNKYVAHPGLAALLPALYPGVFPNLAAYSKARADLVAILQTGIPSGIIPGFQNSPGSTQADLLRLNTGIAPTTTNPSNLGLLGGDLAGFPNGRRVFDDVATIELRAIAGVTIPLVDKSFTPDGAAGLVDFGLTSSGSDTTAMGTEKYLAQFPYLGTPHSGYSAHVGEMVHG